MSAVNRGVRVAIVGQDEANASWAYELGYDERAVKGLLDALGIPDDDELVLSDRVGILAARYMRARENS